MDNPLYKGEEIKKLLNQRAPILMVDKLYSATDNECVCGLTVTKDNFFLTDGQYTEPGLIEHIAQSASAFVGYKALINGTTNAPVGYIGEIKNFKLFKLPTIGDEIVTTISIQSVVMNITLFVAEAKVNGNTIASCLMKLSI